jgi:Ca-activated chloride channel family protein
MTFDPDDPRLTAFALGELDPADREAIETLLLDDPECRAFVTGIEETSKLLADELRNEISALPGLDGTRRDLIETQITKSPVPVLELPVNPSNPPRPFFMNKVFMYATAAGILGVAGIITISTLQNQRDHVQLAQLDYSAATASAPSAKTLNVLSESRVPESVVEEAQVAAKRSMGGYGGKPGSSSAMGFGDQLAGSLGGAVAAPGGAQGNSQNRSLKLVERGANRGPTALSSDPISAPSQTFFKAKLRMGESDPNQALPGGRVTGLGGGGRGTQGTGLGLPSSKPSDQKSANAGFTPRFGTAGVQDPKPGNESFGYKAEAGKTLDASNQPRNRARFDLYGIDGAASATPAAPAVPQGRAMSTAAGAAPREPAGLHGVPSPAGPARPTVNSLHDLSKVDTNPKAGEAIKLGRQMNDGERGNPQTQRQLEAANATDFAGLDVKNEGNFDKLTTNKLSEMSAKSNKESKPSTEGLVEFGQAVQKQQGGQVEQKIENGQTLVEHQGKDAKAVTELALKMPDNSQPQRRGEELRKQITDKQQELERLNQEAALFERQQELRQRRLDREAYARKYDNVFTKVAPGDNLSTFAVDVDTGSYSNIRRMLAQGIMPPVDAVRLEEMVNYFSYDYPLPTGNEPFGVSLEVAGCPWNGSNRLARVGLKGKEIAKDKRPLSNLVFLVDTSGSMADLDKLPLLKAGMKMLVEQLTENDRVAIVTYSNEIKLDLPSTPCHRKTDIFAVLDGLKAQGGTNGGAGVQLAYQTAKENFIKGGSNRVILATDGDFNLGLTKEQLLATSAERAKDGIFLSVLGFGQGNIQEEFMEQLADKGNGNYSYIDSIDEARKVLVRQMSGTLVVIAKDVKVQVKFNPEKVASYRLLGYENRVMENRDFRNDKKDAGEIGAGHTVTAIYEIVPNKSDSPARDVKQLSDKAGRVNFVERSKDLNGKADTSAELLTVALRYKQPDGDKATEFQKNLIDDGRDFGNASTDFKFASAVAGFGMLLRESPHKGTLTLPAVLEIATSSLGADKSGDRKQFLDLIKQVPAIFNPAGQQ